MIELDSLSSGEKNIALTFLIVAQSIHNGGIVLFDEPELHLNPAVSRDVLTFMLDQYSRPRNVQFLMCTHSPEILSGAFLNDECLLLHLKSPSDISRVGRRALDEYSDALAKLGTSVSESLLYDGTVFVEGDGDVTFLETAFPEICRRFKVKDRGGRHEVEKTIRELQTLERSGHSVSPIYVIFDRDDEVSNLSNSACVRIMQWRRRCVENYMLDSDVLSIILKDTTCTRSPISSEGEVHRLLVELANGQVPALAARAVYDSMGYRNASLVKGDVTDSDLGVIASRLYDRMDSARQSLPQQDREAWTTQFSAAAVARSEQLALTWEAKWRDLCDGKKLLSDLHKRSDMKMSEAAFKARIAQIMHDTASEDWRLVRGLLQDLMSL